MADPHQLLVALTLVLGTAAVTTVLCRFLHLPVVLGYLVAGVLVGPHVAISPTADAGIVRSLSEVGVILLMFSIGLDFSLRKLARVGMSAALVAVLQCSVTGWLGYAAGQLLGWTSLESTFTAAIVCISSTTIVVKAFDERQIRGKLRDLALGVLVVQDLIAILLLTLLTALATGHNLSAGDLAETLGRLGGFLAGMVAVGFLVVPRTMRAIVRLNRTEVTLVANVGLCFALALLAHWMGYSVALGAFLAGSLVAESGEEHRIERLVAPVRDVFTAIFFVSVGMLIDPAVIASEVPAILALTAVVVVGQTAAATAGGFLTGNGLRTSLQTGMSLAQIGEFSFILAGLGAALGATGQQLVPIAVAVSVLTTLLTPVLIGASGPVSSFIDRHLPRRLQVITAVYGTWVERLRATPHRSRPLMRRVARAVLLDILLLAALTIGVATMGEGLVARLQTRLGLDRTVAWGLVLAGAVVLAGPFCLGLMTNARRIAVDLARAAFPLPKEGATDPASAPRTTLIVLLQLAVLLLLGMPYLAITQPFLPGLEGVAVLVALLLIPLFTLWRSAADLHGHVRAGAQLIVEAISSQAGSATPRSAHDEKAVAGTIAALLPGLGEPVPFALPAGSPAVGRTLAEVNLRGLTGATVLAIVRDQGKGVVVPSATEVLQPGDVLALAGSAEAVRAARELLSPGGTSPAGPADRARRVTAPPRTREGT